MASLPTILLILAAISMGATVIAALVAFRSQREASSAIFPIVREEEGNRARRARLSIFVWIAITALFVGGWLATLRLRSADTTPANSSTGTVAEVAATGTIAEQDALPQPALAEAQTQPDNSESTPVAIIESPPTATTFPSPEPQPTDTPLPPPPPATDTPPPPDTDTPPPPPTDTPLPPTETPIPPTDTPLPPAPEAADSPTETPTATPTTTVGALEAATVSPRNPAPPGVRVGPIQFATEITEDLEPIDPGKVFPNGINAVYAVFPYRGMSRDLDFKVIWYHNGTEISREEGKWQWGQQASLFVFIGPRGDGLYRLDLYINDSVVATNLFEIIPYPDP